MTARAYGASPADAEAQREDRVVMALSKGLGVAYRRVEAEGVYATRRFDRRPTERVAYRRFFLTRPETCLALSERVHGSSLRSYRRTTTRAFRRH
jgi:hypothetical protein